MARRTPGAAVLRVQGGAAITPLDDMVGVEPHPTATALSLAVLAAPVGALQDLQAPGSMLGRQELGICPLGGGTDCSGVERP